MLLGVRASCTKRKIAREMLARQFLLLPFSITNETQAGGAEKSYLLFAPALACLAAFLAAFSAAILACRSCSFSSAILSR